MLHVLTGSHKGRKLKVPKGQKIRPTTSRVKKSIFDRLGDISGLRILDIFAGSAAGPRMSLSSKRTRPYSRFSFRMLRTAGLETGLI